MQGFRKFNESLDINFIEVKVKSRLVLRLGLLFCINRYASDLTKLRILFVVRSSRSHLGFRIRK